MMIIETDNFIYAFLLTACAMSMEPSVLGVLAILGAAYAVYKAFHHIDPTGV